MVMAVMNTDGHVCGMFTPEPLEQGTRVCGTAGMMLWTFCNEFAVPPPSPSASPGSSVASPLGPEVSRYPTTTKMRAFVGVSVLSIGPVHAFIDTCRPRNG